MDTTTFSSTKLQILAEQENPPPSESIPQQTFPSFLRLALQILLLPLLYLDLAAEKCARFFIRPPYTITGSCQKRGNCCRYILLVQRHGWINTIFLWWSTEIQGFFIRKKLSEEYQQHSILVMGCRHLQANGKCGRYLLRPKVCRTWPIRHTFTKPHLLKGCGYHLKVRSSYAKRYPTLLP